jgi:hypothetical protein
MIVVLDTNIWVAQLALNSKVGSAFRFFLKQRNARLAVPEVIRLETQHNLRRIIEEAVEGVRKGTEQLLALFGSMKEVVLPTNAEVETFVARAFERLGVEIVDVPFSFESARSSFMKTITKEAPSDKNQQFKDGVLWADCLRLLDADDVLLATEDKAFYAERDYKKGLAKNLSAELKGKSKRMVLVSSITEVLQEIGTQVAIDEAWLASALQERVKSHSSFLSNPGIETEGPPKIQTSLFATEDPALVYFTYVLDIPCNDISGEDRKHMRLSSRGDGILRLAPREVVETRLLGAETLAFAKSDGTDATVTAVHLVARDIVLGHRTVEHTVRYPVGGAGQPADEADDPAAGTLV